MALYIEEELIDPAKAKLLLEQNYNNRDPKPAHIRWLADQMRRKEWQMNADPIRVADSGRLLDGQHRLMAIIESNTTQNMLMVYGLDERTFTTIDTGKNRTATDTLKIAGVKEPAMAAAVSRLILSYERAVYTHKMAMKGKVVKLPLTNQDILDFSQAVDLGDFIKKGTKWAKAQPIYSKAEYAFFYWVFYHIDKDLAFAFLNGIATGIGLEADSPIYHLREKMILWKTRKTPPTGIDRLGLTFKAWNYFRESKPASHKFMYDHQEDGFLIPA